MESSRLFGVKRGKQIASSNQLTSYLTKDSQNWFYKPSFLRKGITYCTFLWKHGTFQSCLKPLESEKYIFTDYYILYHTLLQIHWFGYIEECLNFPKYCIWSSLTRIFMIYESFFTKKKNNVLSNICLVYIENNCFVSNRGLLQVKKRAQPAQHISDIQVTLSLAMISSMKEIIKLTFQSIQ